MCSSLHFQSHEPAFWSHFPREHKAECRGWTKCKQTREAQSAPGSGPGTQYFSDLQGHEQLISWHRYSQKQHRLSDLFPGSVKSYLAFSPAERKTKAEIFTSRGKSRNYSGSCSCTYRCDEKQAFVSTQLVFFSLVLSSGLPLTHQKVSQNNPLCWKGSLNPKETAPGKFGSATSIRQGVGETPKGPLDDMNKVFLPDVIKAGWQQTLVSETSTAPLKV